ncbi:MAG: hypothetical protein P1U46_04260 [Patescibacteria group bacterium]|nr:hypothetical protein [Patescibacteria group bacterium]
MKEIHFLSNEIDFPLKANAKIRYRQEDQACIISKENYLYKVEFENNQRAIAR